SEGVSVSVCVVDNGSTDGSIERAESSFKNVHLIRNRENVGLVAARNAGVRWALDLGADYLFFIDNDAWVEPGSLSGLMRVAEEREEALIFSPRIMDATDKRRIWYDGGYVNLFGDTYQKGMGSRLKEDPGGGKDSPVDIEFATGCAMLVRREGFEKVGSFDEEYFVYCEDADFSFRIRRHGKAIVHVPEVRVYHDQSGDTKANRGKWYRDYYVTRNKLLLSRRHLGMARRCAFYLYFAVRGVILPAGYFLITGQFRRTAALFEGVRDYMAGKFGEKYA
ncbi:MAG: glycosyltransferase family 2 protein, partial [Bacteroidota bacterium]